MYSRKINQNLLKLKYYIQSNSSDFKQFQVILSDSWNAHVTYINHIAYINHVTYMNYITNIINIVKLILKLRKKTNQTCPYNFFFLYIWKCLINIIKMKTTPKKISKFFWKKKEKRRKKARERKQNCNEEVKKCQYYRERYRNHFED